MRLNLAQALMCPSDLLLLDEPTNHLDLDAILWLEEWLKGYPGTLVLISHDRDFLDAVVDHVVHLENRKLTLYRGGYSAFERTRAERLAQQQQAYEKQQAQRAHMESFIARFKAKATKARQAQSRIKALERLEELAPAHVDSPFNFSFRESDKISRPLLDLGEGRLGYGDKAVLEKVKLQLVPGARIGLLGPNGAGKSTLIKTLAGDLPGGRPPAARREPGHRILRPAPARFAGPTGQPVAASAAYRPGEREQTLKDFLGGFDFRGVRVDEPVLNFSGGESAPGPGADRLAEAQPAAARRADQPPRPGNAPGPDLGSTGVFRGGPGGFRPAPAQKHHRRIPSGRRWARGAVRWRSRRLRPLAGRLSRAQGAAETAPGAPSERTDKRAQRQAAAALRQQLAPHKREADKLERELGGLHEKLAAIEARLGDSALYDVSRKDELRELLSEQSSLKVREGELEERWLEALETLEALQKELEASGDG